jgi:hypothetical protein
MQDPSTGKGGTQEKEVGVVGEILSAGQDMVTKCIKGNRYGRLIIDMEESMSAGLSMALGGERTGIEEAKIAAWTGGTFRTRKRGWTSWEMIDGEVSSKHACEISHTHYRTCISPRKHVDYLMYNWGSCSLGLLLHTGATLVDNVRLITRAACCDEGKTMKSMEHKIRAEVVKLDLVNLQNNIVITTAVCWGRNRKHRLFGPAFSSDNAGDGPRITIIPKRMVWLGTKYLNLPITITVQEKKIYFEAESVEEFCYNLKELEYSEKHQDSLLVGDGLSFIADQAVMRRLLSGNKMSKTRTGETMREREDRHRR